MGTIFGEPLKLYNPGSDLLPVGYLTVTSSLLRLRIYSTTYLTYHFYIFVSAFLKLTFNWCSTTHAARPFNIYIN